MDPGGLLDPCEEWGGVHLNQAAWIQVVKLWTSIFSAPKKVWWSMKKHNHCLQTRVWHQGFFNPWELEVPKLTQGRCLKARITLSKVYLDHTNLYSKDVEELARTLCLLDMDSNVLDDFDGRFWLFELMCNLNQFWILHQVCRFNHQIL